MLMWGLRVTLFEKVQKFMPARSFGVKKKSILMFKMFPYKHLT